MNTFLTDYYSYMESLARAHSEIGHSAAARHFFRGEVEEFFQQFRSEVRFPCLIVERSDNRYEGNIPLATVKSRQLSFIIADRYDQHDDADEVEAKMSRCERIAEQVLGRMIADPDDDGSNPFIEVDTSTIEGQYLQNMQDRYVGYRLTLEVKEKVCLLNNSVWEQ